MNPLELVASLLAPHLCLVCKKEGLPACLGCISALKYPPLQCYRCKKASDATRICLGCSSASPLDRVYIATTYTGDSKQLLKALKFERAKAASKVIAGVMHNHIPYIAPPVVVIPVPTSNRRIRIRGYDQAVLIAKEFAKLRNLSCKQLLVRESSTRQVGADRKQRFDNLKDAFSTRHLPIKAGTRILLIDDVLTTGATVEAAARLLRSNGYQNISAAVFAH